MQSLNLDLLNRYHEFFNTETCLYGWPEWGAIPPYASGFIPPDKLPHIGYLIDKIGDFSIIQCSPCILNHIVPIPDQAFLSDYYRNKFYQQSKPDYESRYNEDRKWWEVWHRYTESQVSEANLNAGKRMMDIGSGPGIMLDVARESGWQAYGIEPSVGIKSKSEYIHNTTLAEFIASIPSSRGSFEWINAYEVLEHVAEPEDFLLQCHELLTDNGILTVTVPNDYNPLQIRARAKHRLSSYWVSPLEHLNYFTPKMLQLLVRRCGYVILDISGTFPMEIFILEGINYVGNDELGRNCHANRKAFEMEMYHTHRWHELMQTYRLFIHSARMGREIRLIARKR